MVVVLVVVRVIVVVVEIVEMMGAQWAVKRKRKFGGWLVLGLG